MNGMYAQLLVIGLVVTVGVGVIGCLVDVFPEFSRSTDPKTVAFVKKFKDRYHEDADVMAALAYDSVYVLAEAIKKTKEPTALNIRDELAKIKDFAGVTGKMSMDENRDAVKSAVVVQVQGNNYKYITTVNP